MANNTQRRPSSGPGRFPRSASGGAAGRPGRPGRPNRPGRPAAGTSAARFGRGSTPSPASSRFGRGSTPSPSSSRFGRSSAPRKTKSGGSPMDRLPFGGRSAQKSSGPAKALQGLTSAFGGSKKGKSSGGSKGKSAGGLAALAGIAGLAIKNRSKITDKLGGGRHNEPEVTPVDSVSPATPTTPPPTTPPAI
jgi:hypothetical protein